VQEPEQVIWDEQQREAFGTASELRSEEIAVNIVSASSSGVLPAASSLLNTPAAESLNTTSASTSAEHSQPEATQSVDRDKLAKAVEELNKRLVSGSTEVVMDFDAPANRIWLNVIDKTTGEVIQKIPPEGLRKYLDSNSIAGLALDIQF
jgi:uncharacterized FlaG/YvyC family protein